MEWFDRFNRRVIVVLALLAAGFASGCGGGGGGVSSSAQNLRSFDPNYLPDLKSVTHWAAFPVKVYFEPGLDYTPARQALAESGIAQWNDRTGGLVRYTVTADAAQAQVVIHFVDKLEGTLIGWTNWSFDDRGAIQHADTKIVVTGLSDVDVRWVAAHEFGHALGLDGHSKQAQDVMFASHALGNSWDLTTRDENTVKTNYDWLLNGGSPAGRAVIWGSEHTAEVKCYRP
jgi:hypothetical protein